MDKLPSVDGDLLDTESLEEIIGAGLVQGEFGDRLKEINDPAVFKLAFLSFILSHLLCPNSKAQIKESISSLKSKIESIRRTGWCNYIYAQLMIAIHEFKSNYSSWEKGSKKGTSVHGCMYILAVIHLDFLDTPDKPHPGYPCILHITNNHFRQMKKLHFKYLLLKDTVYANCDEMLSEVASASTNTGCLEVSSSGITSTHDAAECFNERKRKMLHVKEAMGARSKRLVKTATYKQEQVHPVVITSGAKESDNVRSAPAEAAAAPTEIGASSASVVYEGQEEEVTLECDASQDSTREQDKIVPGKHAKDTSGVGGHTAPSHNDVATTDYEKHCVFARGVKDKLSDKQKCWLQNTVSSNSVPEIPFYVFQMNIKLRGEMYFSAQYSKDYLIKHFPKRRGWNIKISAAHGGGSACAIDMKCVVQGSCIACRGPEWRTFVEANRMEIHVLCAFGFKFESRIPSLYVSVFHE
ncbi:hypothetical protein ACQJBY_013082 [Aegilops geniculata]